MSFGFSVGDFVAVGKVVLQLYNACRNAPREFQEISGELSSIHTVLSGLAEQAKDPTSLLLRRGGDRSLEWISIRENLESTLAELQDLVGRYQNMGRNAWLRMRMGSKNLDGLRSKLDFHLGVINTFVGSLALSALGRMEPVLGRIESLLRESVREERAGHKTPTVLTAHETNDVVSWKQIEMDLLLEGITREDFEKNKERIRELLNWVVSNECDLANLRDVEPGDSVSCAATTRTNPFETTVSKLHSSTLSMLDEIFGLPSAPDTGANIHLKSIYQTNDPPSQVQLSFNYPPPATDDIFGPSSINHDVEEDLYRVSSNLEKEIDDVWNSLDLEPSQVVENYNTAILGQRYFSPLSDDHKSNATELFLHHDPFYYLCRDPFCHPYITKGQDGWVTDYDQASDTESTIGPQIFWRGSEWSAEEHNAYMMLEDYDLDAWDDVKSESAYSDSNFSEPDNTEELQSADSIEAENGDPDNENEEDKINEKLWYDGQERKLILAGWEPLDG